MMNRANKFLSVVLILILLASSLCLITYANENTKKHYFDGLVNTGKDNGYSGSSKIDEDDPHFGWKLGEFYVSGFTSEVNDENGNPVFLKTVGDKVTLWFNLQQDINKLNGDSDFSICADTNGYDEYFGIEKTNFGVGTLIIRHKDHENHWSDPVIYTDFLSAKASNGANTEVELFEEGDYEVALNYEIKEINMNIFGWKPFPSYHNYRIFFRFSVRNGNCMVYPFDVETKAELTNSSITENGFYLDLAKSRYLDINIKKEILKEGAEGLTEDVRFNRPAKDGDQYTEEGIYTITVSNRYTNQQTVKKIYVGTNSVLKAHVTTGLTISEINHQLSLGATINPDGTITPAEGTELPPAETTPDENIVPPSNSTNNPVDNPNKTPLGNKTTDLSIPIIIGSVCGVLLISTVILLIRKRKQTKACTFDSTGGDDK